MIADHIPKIISLRSRQGANGNDPPIDGPQMEDPPEYGELEAWKGQLHWGAGKRLKGTTTNLAIILENDPRMAGRIGYNEMDEQPWIVGEVPWGADKGPITEAGMIALRCWIANKDFSGYAMDEPGRFATKDALLHVSKIHRYNPLEDWLRSLVWDGTPRVDHFLEDAYGLPWTDYHLAVSRVLLIGAVQRALRPGCKMDYMVILEGKQGMYKSTSLRKLYGDFLLEKSPIGFESLNSLLEMAGYWAIEVPDLDSFSRTEVNVVKNFLSRTIDVYKQPYGMSAIKAARRTIIVGTTNDAHYLQDDTGNRRFLPFRPVKINLDYIEQNREQLFAEAVARCGESVELRGQALGSAVEETERVLIEDPWVDRIGEALSGVQRAIPMAEVLGEILKVEISKQGKTEQIRAGKAMRKLGYQRKKTRIGDRALWLWVRQ